METIKYTLAGSLDGVMYCDDPLWVTGVALSPLWVRRELRRAIANMIRDWGVIQERAPGVGAVLVLRLERMCSPSYQRKRVCMLRYQWDGVQWIKEQRPGD